MAVSFGTTVLNGLNHVSDAFNSTVNIGANAFLYIFKTATSEVNKRYLKPNNELFGNGAPKGNSILKALHFVRPIPVLGFITCLLVRTEIHERYSEVLGGVRNVFFQDRNPGKTGLKAWQRHNIKVFKEDNLNERMMQRVRAIVAIALVWSNLCPISIPVLVTIAAVDFLYTEYMLYQAKEHDKDINKMIKGGLVDTGRSSIPSLIVVEGS